jgi:Beta-lactamase class C and other penicillin binding proteins
MKHFGSWMVRRHDRDGSPLHGGAVHAMRCALRFGIMLPSVLGCDVHAAIHDQPDRFAAIDRYVTAKLRSSRIPGLSLAVVEGDSIVFLAGYGSADPSGRPVTPRTPFLIGSITKAFTALATLQLAEAGAIDLDAPVRRYVPWFETADGHASTVITVRHLLTMTSGLPQLYETQFWTANDDAALERSVRLLQHVELADPPGESFTYSNANSETLGLIIQTVSGESYEEYVTRHILEPLAMRNSFTSQDEAERHGMASGYRWWFGIPVAVALPYNRAELPAGYIIASAEDMAHFVIAQLDTGRYRDARVLSPAGIELMQREPPPRAFGNGWESVRIGGHRLVNLDGGTANFQASLFFDPEARVGVFIAANVVNALDTFSSPSGSSVLDGPTARGMAMTVLSMVTNRPLPDVGPGHERLTLIFDLVLLALTIALAISLWRISGWYRQSARRGVGSRAELARRMVTILVTGFTLPVLLVYLAFVPAWRVVARFQPDLAWWLYAAGAVLLVKGVVEIVLLRRIFGATRYPTHP